MGKEIIGMLLAGGEGKRLGQLTKDTAKPAVPFGGKYRIIDFTLSNCTHSNIDTVGVLTQYQPMDLNRHLGSGSPWELDRKYGGISILPPFTVQAGGGWYSGTADAIYQNMQFIDQYDPEYILVISGDHIYKMNYDAMLEQHKKENADATISVLEVPWEDASRFGIMNTNEQMEVIEFQEKPKEPKNNLASMGIYIFTWSSLRDYLIKDAENSESSHDFGKDIIPMMLEDERKLKAFSFHGYWKDVGTIKSYWEANMDLLDQNSGLRLHDRSWRIYTVNPNQPPHYMGKESTVSNSLINEGCHVLGHIKRSVLFQGVRVEEGSTIKDSVIMPEVKIGSNVTLEKVIVRPGTVIPDNCVIAFDKAEDCMVVDNDTSFKQFLPSNQR
ncbi:glucose-1-phosphate adenylyltransferase [Sinobaca sp. H24]|uniref:glucose-1-phosphate adenylyltransferase n=1 Tax=Sinobaca sp. H24 TaxID=2923376 RepID=UPI002097E16F|nr:glucose-1-phosphate adenylyltransferase [Sinobaca sp. H24]